MNFPFEWNDLADQPHNVAPRSERTRHHLKRWPLYLQLLGANLFHAPAIVRRYRRNRRLMHRREILIRPEMFGLALSPHFDRPDRTETTLALLRGTGIRQALFRVPSWERARLSEYETFARGLAAEGFDLTAALLQRRQDVLEIESWTDFAAETFDRLGPHCSRFEVGHAWNRTKWGVWDHREYIRLARAAAAARDRSAGRRPPALIGPAVIDFEFHLYPSVLRAVDFDVVSSLLYVDRVGAPERAQAGWTTAMKIALLEAYAAASSRRPAPVWITEVNWPLEGTGAWSPAAGKPNVNEDDQADYLVRFYVIALTSGLIERVYWWQLVAPGYGLVDSRETPWRRRPAYEALSTLAGELSGAVFLGKDGGAEGAEVYRFRKNGRMFALAWTTGGPITHDFGRSVREIRDRAGRTQPSPGRSGVVRLEGRASYVLFE